MLHEIAQNIGMKTLTITLLLVSFFSNCLAATPPTKVRTLKDLNVISTGVLRRSVSANFYKSLLISPVEGWVAVRAQLVGTHLTAMKIAHSELNHEYDALALELARTAQLTRYDRIDKQSLSVPVLYQVLIFRCADGPMVLSFPQLAEAGGDQLPSFGCARLAVLKSDGRWVEIKGPEALQGKGWAVGPTLNKSLAALFKLENLHMHF